MTGKKLPLASAVVVFAAAIIGVLTPGAVAGNGKTKCGSAPAPAAGSTVTGGLEVDGTCILVDVTVNGGVVIDSTGALSQQGGTISGGITVDPGGEIDLNATTNGGGVPTGTTSTVNGDVTINGAFDSDLWAARINGGLTVNASGVFVQICGNDVTGDSSISGASGTIGVGGFFGCNGNTFRSSLSLTNSVFTFGGNAIGNNLLCTNTVLIVTAPNTIGGTNTCY
jgi:hypothetical protein